MLKLQSQHIEIADTTRLCSRSCPLGGLFHGGNMWMQLCIDMMPVCMGESQRIQIWIGWIGEPQGWMWAEIWADIDFRLPKASQLPPEFIIFPQMEQPF